MTEYQQNPDDAWLDGHTAIKTLEELKTGDRFVLHGECFEALDWHVYEVAEGHVYPQGCAEDPNWQCGTVYLVGDLPIMFSRWSRRVVRVLNPDIDPDEFLAQYVHRRAQRLTPNARNLLTFRLAYYFGDPK